MIEIKSKKFLLFLKLRDVEIVKLDNRYYAKLNLDRYEKLLREYKKIVNEF